LRHEFGVKNSDPITVRPLATNWEYFRISSIESARDEEDDRQISATGLGI
jgi:hypothetical protein